MLNSFNFYLSSLLCVKFHACRSHDEKDRVQALRQLDHKLLYLIQSFKKKDNSMWSLLLGNECQLGPEKAFKNNNLDLHGQRIVSNKEVHIIYRCLR